MRVERMTIMVLALFVVVSVFITATAHRGYAFDRGKIAAAKSSAADMARHITSMQSGYYSYGLECIEGDIIAKKGQMADPAIKQKAKDCISYYKTGFSNLNSRYSRWEADSRALRDDLLDENGKK